MEKNAELMAKIDQLETILNNRENLIDSLHSELDSLKKEHGIGVNHQEHLENDLKELEDGIAAIENENADLIEKLREWQRKDDEIKEMINRKQEVEASKNKSGNQLGVAVQTLDKVKNSPNRKKTVNLIAQSPQRQWEAWLTRKFEIFIFILSTKIFLILITFPIFTFTATLLKYYPSIIKF